MAGTVWLHLAIAESARVEFGLAPRPTSRQGSAASTTSICGRARLLGSRRSRRRSTLRSPAHTSSRPDDLRMPGPPPAGGDILSRKSVTAEPKGRACGVHPYGDANHRALYASAWRAVPVKVAFAANLAVQTPVGNEGAAPAPRLHSGRHHCRRRRALLARHVPVDPCKTRKAGHRDHRARHRPRARSATCLPCRR